MQINTALPIMQQEAAVANRESAVIHRGPIASDAFVPSGSPQPVSRGNGTPFHVCVYCGPLFKSPSGRSGTFFAPFQVSFQEDGRLISRLHPFSDGVSWKRTSSHRIGWRQTQKRQRVGPVANSNEPRS